MSQSKLKKGKKVSYYIDTVIVERFKKPYLSGCFQKRLPDCWWR